MRTGGKKAGARCCAVTLSSCATPIWQQKAQVIIQSLPFGSNIKMMKLLILFCDSTNFVLKLNTKFKILKWHIHGHQEWLLSKLLSRGDGHDWNGWRWFWQIAFLRLWVTLLRWTLFTVRCSRTEAGGVEDIGSQPEIILTSSHCHCHEKVEWEEREGRRRK